MTDEYKSAARQARNSNNLHLLPHDPAGIVLSNNLHLLSPHILPAIPQRQTVSTAQNIRMPCREPATPLSPTTIPAVHLPRARHRP